MDRYIYKNGKKLRYGYTTGSCATAATKAAVLMMETGKKVDSIEISTPKGWDLTIEVFDVEITDDYVKCSVVKDGGDDIDATNGMKIFSMVKVRDDEEIEVSGGIGVGQVTQPGLSIPVGRPAINKTPLAMIEKAIRKVSSKGYDVCISAPEGVEIAKRTFNPKLGIVGGVSIIGTTGIVEPMSEEAFKDSLSIELSHLRAKGADTVLFSPGNYGRDHSISEGINTDNLIKTSNFIGFMIDEASRMGFKKIVWVGHIGKMVKVAGGIFHTHSKMADGRMEVLMANLAMMEAPIELIKLVKGSLTTDEAITYINDYGYEDVYDRLAEEITKRTIIRSYDTLEVGTMIFSNEFGTLGKCSKFEEMVSEL